MNKWFWTMTMAGSVSTVLGCAGDELPARALKAGGRATGAPVNVTSSGGGGDFRYEKAIIAPKSLEIRGINGNVKVAGTSSGTADVRATKRTGKGDPASQKVVVTEHEAGVVICALYANQPDSDCKPDDGRGQNKGEGNGDLAIDFDIRAPVGVSLSVRTMNGNIEAKDLRSGLRVLTMNGDLDVATTGHLVGKTMNGRIVAPLSRSVTVPVQLEAMNGSIELRAPDGASFDLNASTMSGRIDSDFPIPALGGPPGVPASVTAKIGGGGARVALKAMNGDISVKRSH